jgi:hypothetical protein
VSNEDGGDKRAGAQKAIKDDFLLALGSAPDLIFWRGKILAILQTARRTEFGARRTK